MVPRGTRESGSKAQVLNQLVPGLSGMRLVKIVRSGLLTLPHSPRAPLQTWLQMSSLALGLWPQISPGEHPKAPPTSPGHLWASRAGTGQIFLDLVLLAPGKGSYWSCPV